MPDGIDIWNKLINRTNISAQCFNYWIFCLSSTLILKISKITYLPYICRA